jgi:pentatricopeptide repeat protein
MRRQGMMEEAVELVATMRSRFGVPPDHATFGTALAGCREAGEPALVTALLEALFLEAEARERDAREDVRLVRTLPLHCPNACAAPPPRVGGGLDPGQWHHPSPGPTPVPTKHFFLSRL